MILILYILCLSAGSSTSSLLITPKNPKPQTSDIGAEASKLIESSTAISTAATPTSHMQGFDADLEHPKGKPKDTTPVQEKKKKVEQPFGDRVTGQDPQPPIFNSTDIDGNRRTGRSSSKPGQWGGFYLAEMIVVCNSPEQTIRTTVSNYAAWDTYGLGPDSHADWNYLVGAFGRANVLDLIRNKGLECAGCDCQTDVEDNDLQWGLKPNERNPNCDTQEKADLCQLVFNCACQESLTFAGGRVSGGPGILHSKGDPQLGYGIYVKGPVRDGGHRRIQSRPYDTQILGGGYQVQGYAEGIDDLVPTEPRGRQLDPDTKEPYYLEGPEEVGESRQGSLARLGGLAAGYGTFLADKIISRVPGGRKSSRFRKRENSGVDGFEELYTSNKPERTAVT
ncbi:hypothetical protein TWF506_001063 [Arthrobotrys conoides]|uniref:Uncharacterized protein n=1 Tax=Arthrobotrys conoides TaxID=74498 RepID=A0AAN8NX38_9PEZI